MPFFGNPLRAAALALLLPALLGARPFTAVVYNVENLFDVDGVAHYDDYQSALYTPAHLRTKLAGIAEVLARFEDGRGPDLILFQEIELDQTPDSAVRDYAAFLQRHAGTTYDRMLGASPLPAELAGLPAEAWLLKALHDRGLRGYTVAAGDDPVARHEDGNPRAIKTVVFTRLPVRAVRSHPTLNARHVLEVELEIDDHRLHVFNNHWKSGASDPATEEFRRANARTLRTRLDAILQADPNADILIGGDFNSQHDQKLRYPEMKETGLNDVLRAQGNELAIRGPQRDLYNLWYELPSDQRGSDTYRGEWGTLMQMIVSRGLYDRRGVQYVDNSFAVARFASLNADAAGLPLRWSGDPPAGRGFSDHFPIYARFVTVEDNRPDRWIALTRPSDRDPTEADVNRISFAAVDLAGTALTLAGLPAGANLRDGRYSGRLFRVEGRAPEGAPLQVEFAGETYDVYSPEPAVRDLLAAQRRESGRLRFYGELGTFRGRWQFVVRDAGWVK